MELNGEITIDAAPARVWQALNDPRVLLACVPGCEEVQQISPTQTLVRVLLKMGPVRARFVGKVLMSDVREGAGCTLNFEGSGGAAGFAKGQSNVALAAQGAGTRLSYSAQATVGGKLGQIGGRMVDASAKQMADQFFQAFRAELAAAPADAATAAPTPRPTPADATATASTVPTPPTVFARPPATPAAAGEGVRLLWFAMGALATAFGFAVAAYLLRH